MDPSARDLLEELRVCACCPRNCAARRLDGELGYCGAGAGFGIGAICIHRGEEPPIAGQHGICNVFFTRCNLQCLYCQNHQISRNRQPQIEYQLQLTDVVREIERLLGLGARSVGFVSPSHCIPQMKAVIRTLRAGGRKPTFVMNTNAYDKVETIASLESLIGVYLPDLKYMDASLASDLSDVSDYPMVATAAIREMHRQKGSNLILDETGSAQSGLIIRHLVLPGQVENSRRCLRWIAEELSPSVHVSLLAQYQPTPAVAGHPDLGRRLRPEEYQQVLDELKALGFWRGWTQELASSDSYCPDFAQSHPFEWK